MKMFIIPIVVFLIVTPILIEVSHVMVYGGFIADDQLDAYLGKYLDQARLNEFSSDASLFAGLPRYVSVSQSFLSKWHIQGYGTIPRWSKWSKRLDERRAELRPQVPQLSEL